MASIEHKPTDAVLALRTDAEGRPEVYVVAGGVEYTLDVSRIDLHPITHHSMLTATITAPIGKLG